MSHVEPTRISVRFAPAFLAELDDYRRQLEDIPDRAQAIRQLCEQALATQSTTTKKRGSASRRTAAR
jgi:metal-responsive CopG/Arc/MetJ family transcriptional regulator